MALKTPRTNSLLLPEQLVVRLLQMVSLFAQSKIGGDVLGLESILNLMEAAAQ